MPQHTYATPTFITEALHFATYVQMSTKVKVIATASAYCIRSTHFNSKVTNNINYNCHMKLFNHSRTISRNQACASKAPGLITANTGQLPRHEKQIVYTVNILEGELLWFSWIFT